MPQNPSAARPTEGGQGSALRGVLHVPTIVIETFIASAPRRCFDLARNVDVHCFTSEFTRERAVLPGKTSGLLEEGDLVTFEGRHLGVTQRLTARITEMRAPDRFVDQQVRGAFKWLRHVHEFEALAGGTLMRDSITWRSPFGILGSMADVIALRPHLTWFLTKKQHALKLLAESGSAV
jgi:ligand-binding SRPBCC domain-containing protein